MITTVDSEQAEMGRKKKKSSCTFAEKLKAIREEAGLTKYALAKKAGISRQGLSQLESGESLPSWETVQLLVRALGVACEDFLTIPEDTEID